MKNRLLSTSAAVDRRQVYCAAVGGGVVALLQLLDPASAAACYSGNPLTPPPPVTVNYANQSFTLGTPYGVFGQGLSGCMGSSGGTDSNGNPGYPAQPGPQVTNSASNVTILGPTQFQPMLYSYGATVGSSGGNGGYGGDGGAAVLASVEGGAGGRGGDGGAVAINFAGKINPASNGTLADDAISITSSGGFGGVGGTTGTFGAGQKQGGIGGAGGNGGAVRFTGSGSIVSNSSGVKVSSFGGNGLQGGSVTSTDGLSEIFGGAGGQGGQGGAVTLAWNGKIVTGLVGLIAYSDGGFGGDGGSAQYAAQNTGRNGGTGGAAGSADAVLTGGIIFVTEAFWDSRNGAVVALAEGNTGGVGGLGGATISATAGSGGTGGAGGTASATVLGQASFVGAGTDLGHAVYVSSSGGSGGAGGSATGIEGGAGGGGLAGAGGTASLTIGSLTQAGSITASGKYANAALVQSIGGGGGSGGQGFFHTNGGSGAGGGDGGPVTVNAVNGTVVTQGASSSALIAQSIGGGGGVGGDTNDIAIGPTLAIGGNGGVGGNGALVTIVLGANSILGSLDTLGDGGVLAQSIGGAGGSGGSAVAKGSGLLILTIGGDSGGGGVAGKVLVTSAGLVTSYGDHAAGIQAQSIGGGGGKGGSATSFNVGFLPVASVAVGGRGGGGGPGDNATIDNAGQVTTFGSDAYGVVAQSIGGGGGSGGAAVARAISISPDKRIPAISISVGLGGSGGSGNTGATAAITNTGLITTAGEGSYALLTQSIGGGGGTGGDSTAASYSGGSAGGLKLAISVAVGGTGGNAGTGGSANLSNAGLLLTLGTDAYGMIAQSIGGGGGAGGGGDATSTSGMAQASIGVAIAVGGKGGTGGHGGTVDAASTGGIATGGDGADALFAQSVGGGGGAGGGGTASANGKQLSVAVSVGGGGGAGGDGGGVIAGNDGAIVTRGVDANGIFAQSVGGGGGKGGKAGSTSGGVNPINNASALFNNLAGGLNIGGNVTEPVNGIFKVAGLRNEVIKSVEELQQIAKQLAGGGGGGTVAKNLDVSVSVGGSGGAAGKGGTVDATNTAAIVTFGAQSDGVFAQSVGGGGGKGGASSSTDKSADDGRNQASIGVGGSGSAGGDGGTVDVTNAKAATILTEGVLGFGVVAQSVGGGGGAAGMAATVAGSLHSLSVNVGGNDGAQGSGGAVTIDNIGAIATTGKHGIAIFAQSVGGGGGLVRTMTTDQAFDPAKILDNPQGRLGDVHGLDLSFGGASNATGNAGAVQVNMAGTITTTGRTAFGILAQSIGGGGGAAIGGQLLADIAAANTNDGNGGTVGVTTTAGASIATTGDGAYGILAQSIGGGGGLGGDLANVTRATTDMGSGIVVVGKGSGADVTIALTGTKVTTSGAFAPAVFAQSVGGGGGLLSYNGALLAGSKGGSGTGGDLVAVTLTNTIITANGQHSPGIMLQNRSATNGATTVNVGPSSSVIGGRTNDLTDLTMTGSIYILGGTDTQNTIINNGLIGEVGQICINIEGGAATISGGGIWNGDIINARNGSFDLFAGGSINARNINLGGGQFSDAGTIHVGGIGTVGGTTLTGDLVQSATGVISIDVDPATGKADLLQITGKAVLGGTLTVNSAVFHKGTTAPVVTAAGGITGTPLVQGFLTPIFVRTAVITATSVAIKTDADFKADDAGKSATQRSLAAHLQQIWDSGSTAFDQGFASLGSLASTGDYTRTLDNLSGQEIAAVSASRYEASQTFARDAFGCPIGSDRQDAGGRTRCGWARVVGVTNDHDAERGFPAYNWQAVSFKLGGEIGVGPNLSLAGSAGYESGKLHSEDRRARTRTDTGLALVGLRYRTGAWTIDGVVDLAYGGVRTERTIDLAGSAVAFGATRAFNAGLHLRTAYQLPAGALYVEPALELDANYVRLDRYTETGAGVFDLQVDTPGKVVLAATPGVRVGTRVQSSANTTTNVYAGAGVSFLHGNRFDVDSRFASVSDVSGGFRGTLINDNIVGRFNAGVEISTAGRLSLRLQYDGRRSSNQTEHGGEARLAYSF